MNRFTMTRLRLAGLLAVVSASMLLVASAPAMAQGGGDGGGGKDRADNVPARIAVKLRRAMRAMDRAGDHIDDGEDGKAIRSLVSARKNFNLAVSRTVKRVKDASNGSVASANAVVVAADRIIELTIGEMDGANGALDDSLSATLAAGVEGRADIVNATGSVGASVSARQGGDYEPHPSGDYERVLMRVVTDCKSELSDIEESLDEDQLTAKARAALGDAKDGIDETKVAAKSLLEGSAPPSDGDGSGEPEPKPLPD